MKKNILLLSTGGTIASRPGKEGLAPQLGGGPLLRELGDGLNREYHFDCRDILRMDSSNIQPEQWQLIGGRFTGVWRIMTALS